MSYIELGGGGLGSRLIYSVHIWRVCSCVLYRVRRRRPGIEANIQCACMEGVFLCPI